MTIRVLLCEDDALTRVGLAYVIGGDPGMHVVGEAVDGREAVRLGRLLSPDVVVMDIRMPGLDGIEATRQLTTRDDPVPKVLVLTTFQVDEYVYRALRAGASGFLLKDAEPDELLDGIRVVAAGEGVLAPAVTRRLIQRFAGRDPDDGGTDRLHRLTARERDVLRLVATGMSNVEIADDLGIARETVKTHVSRILVKLGLRDRIHAVVFAHQNDLQR